MCFQSQCIPFVLKNRQQWWYWSKCRRAWAKGAWWSELYEVIRGEILVCHWILAMFWNISFNETFLKDIPFGRQCDQYSLQSSRPTAFCWSYGDLRSFAWNCSALATERLIRLNLETHWRTASCSSSVVMIWRSDRLPGCCSAKILVRFDNFAWHKYTMNAKVSIGFFWHTKLL